VLPLASVAVIVISLLDGVVALPDITPAKFNVMPVGNAPEVTANVYGP
jgi:hypothetical protein